ncbi:hypothetical protein GCM10007908_04170 [Rhizobium albus]|nr:hypothetical protein GCM10007908_04170 [Rhizobium albus]
MEAAGAPLGAYIKEKVLGSAPVRKRRAGQAVQDREALARLVAVLGKSRLFQNLSEMADAARSGSLPVSPELEEELTAMLAEIRALRQMLLTALGLQPEERP